MSQWLDVCWLEVKQKEQTMNDLDTFNNKAQKAIDSELEIDLIILGPKSNSVKTELFLGSTSGSIVK
jgi:hypothetical protein